VNIPVLIVAGPLLGIIGIITTLIVSRKISAKTNQLLADTNYADTNVKCECVIRDGAIECLGVVLVANNTLIIRSVFNKKREIPLASVTLIKEGAGFGRYYWWGKRIFYLKTPETTNLAIGVKDPEPWRKVFGQKT